MSTPLTSSRAVVHTTKARRYAKQLAAHLGHRLTTSWDEEAGKGVIEFDAGRCELTTTADELGLDASLDYAIDPGLAAEHLARIEDVVGRHLVRFGAKDELVAQWVRSDGSPGLTHRGEGEGPAGLH
jgi:hypothetical protein